MCLIQCNDVVQELSPATPDPALRDAVLPGRLHARTFGLYSRCPQERHHFRTKPCVLIQDDVTTSAGFRKCLSQLLDNPFRGGMFGNVAVQNLATFVLYYKEAIKYSERHCRHGEEVECGDHLTVILQEGEPLFIGVAASNNTASISGDASLRNTKSEFLQFRVDFRSSPVGILLCETSD